MLKKKQSKNLKGMTYNPVPKRMAPRQQPGVYIILCIANNKRYYGESINVSARISQHKSRLRRNIHEISELQSDWNQHGEEAFECSALFMSINSNKDQRQALELNYISHHFDLCYNKFAQSSRKKQNNPFWGRKHTEETRKQISRSLAENYQNCKLEGISIVLKGKLYPSISEASRQTNHSRDTIRRWLENPNSPHCKRIGSLNTDMIKEEKQQNRASGVSKPVCLNGTEYPSIAEASRQLDCSRANIQRLLKTDKKNCFFLS
jgi:group I intron endonuclease